MLKDVYHYEMYIQGNGIMETIFIFALCISGHDQTADCFVISVMGMIILFIFNFINRMESEKITTSPVYL